MTRELVRTSKFLSLVLRHRPEKIGLTLDANGWADVSELLEKANASGRAISKELLHEVVANNDKQRFAFNTDSTRLRANQGHSIAIDLELEPAIPPTELFHGTASRFISSIRQSGLRKQNRQHVHLSLDEETATRVGKRHGTPVILKIESVRMVESGHTFFLSKNNVWLTDSVPVDFIVFPRG